MTHATLMDDLDQLDFVGTPFNPGDWITWITADPVPQPGVTQPVGSLQDTLDDFVRSMRLSVTEAHASALQAVHQLQYRTAAEVIR